MKTHLIGNTIIKPLSFCGENIGFELSSKGGIFIPPFETYQVEGEHNLTTCENCQNNLAQLTKQFTLWFEGKHKNGVKPFPYCCQWHEKLSTLKEFSMDFFLNTPKISAEKIIYTDQLIHNKHNSEDWYKEITNYIDLTITSFGKMPNDCGNPLFLADYFNQITYLLEQNKDIESEKKNRLLEFISKRKYPNKGKKTDLDILLETYENWIKLFPFEMKVYFGDLEEYFKKQYFTILFKKAEINIYSGFTTLTPHSKSSLIKVLIGLTNDIIVKYNSKKLYDEGLLTEPEKMKKYVLLRQREMKLKQGYLSISPNEEQQYREMLNEWFEDEKKFIDEMTPYIKKEVMQKNETKTDKLKVNQIALIHIYEEIQITRENAGEIAAKHGYTAKTSGEGLYQDYTKYCISSDRTAKPTAETKKTLINKITLFESIVNHLSDNKKQRAIDEINILKTLLKSEYQ